jgi:hypothetical protein
MATAPAAPPSALEQRTWRKAAQRALRIALTAFKEAGTQCADANAAGQRAGTQLSNAVLTAMHLPAMPLGVLADVEGLPHAAAAKLAARAAECLQQLQAAAEQQAAAAQAMEAALGAVRGCVDQPDWQDRQPVFQSLSVPAAAAMLQQVVDMHCAELAVKWQLLAGFEHVVGACDVLHTQVRERLPAAAGCKHARARSG